MSTNLALKLASQSLAVQLAALDSDLRSDRRKNLFGVSHESPRFGNCRIDPDPEVVVFEHFGHGTHLTGFGEMAAERAGSSGKLALTLRPFRTQGQLNPGRQDDAERRSSSSIQRRSDESSRLTSIGFPYEVVLHAVAERTDHLSRYSRRDHSARSESNQRTQLC
jgi:hypothetical protein